MSGTAYTDVGHTPTSEKEDHIRKIRSVTSAPGCSKIVHSQKEELDLCADSHVNKTQGDKTFRHEVRSQILLPAIGICSRHSARASQAILSSAWFGG